MRTLPTALMLIGLISPLPTYAQLSLQQLQQQAYQLDPQLQYLIRQNETDNLRVQQSGRLANPEIAIQADNLGNASLKDLDGIMLFSLIRLLCNKAFYERYIPVKRIVVDRVGEVQRIVGGFPFVFLIDGDFTSPGNKISILFIFWDTDEFLLNYFLLDYLFWFGLILVFHLFIQKLRAKK